MYNIGIVLANEQAETTYQKQLSKKTHQVYKLSSQEALSEASNMDALIIEESSAMELKDTCELILEIRKNCNIIIWIFSKNISKTSKMVYLQLGADGVADQENEYEEAILQLSNVLKRVKVKSEEDTIQMNPDSTKTNSNSSCPFKLISNNLSVYIEGEAEISLTKLEFQIISFLVSNKGNAVTYEEIYHNVWKDEFTNSEDGNKQYRVSNLIFHLRKKLEVDTAKPKYIKTVRSKGYMLVA